jgi:mannose-6-phosphate isomerase
MIRRLHNQVRPYAWGSRTHIARLTGQHLGPGPAAEMWIGAHPTAPSRVESGAGLDDVVAMDPERTLGRDVVTRLGPRLPFLVKLLAAREPLSLQVHPPRERARRRFREQEAAGLARDASTRSYPDASHKPELVHALTRFEGMAGFRDVAATAVILRDLRLDWLDAVADRLTSAPDPAGCLHAVVTEWLSLPRADVRRRLAAVRTAAGQAEARAHGTGRLHRPAPLEASEVARESVRVHAATAQLIQRYPDDPGVLVTLLLNHVVLAPGESMFIDAGTVHAYTSGFGVEIMAASDNVLRAGLTPKHVDIPELLEVADFRPVPPPRWEAEVDGCVTRLAPPVEEFELVLLDLDGSTHTLDGVGPRLAMCLAGTVALSTPTHQLTLAQGESAFVEAVGGALTVGGRGRVAVGQTPGAA